MLTAFFTERHAVPLVRPLNNEEQLQDVTKVWSGYGYGCRCGQLQDMTKVWSVRPGYGYAMAMAMAMGVDVVQGMTIVWL